MRIPRTLANAYRVYAREHLAQAGKGTDAKYRTALTAFRRSLGDREPLLMDLTDANLRSLLSMLVAEGLAAPSANAIRSKLVCLWTWLSKTGKLRTWPTVKPLIEPEQTPIAWRPEQLAKLWDAAGNAPGDVMGIPAGDWWLGLVSTCYDTGERIGAVMLLTWDDVDLDSRFVTFRAETRKGKRKANVQRLHPDTVALLRAIKPCGHASVFPWPMTREMLFVEYDKILKVAGLPTGRKRKFHCLRKTHATLLEVAGGNGTESLGHSERSTTLNSYIDSTQIEKPRACDLLPRPITNP